MKCAKLDGVADHLRDGVEDAPVVVDAVHLHRIHCELHNIPDVVEAQIFVQRLHLLHLAVLADREHGEAPKEALQGTEDLGPGHGVVILDEGEVADQVGQVGGKCLLQSLLGGVQILKN